MGNFSNAFHLILQLSSWKLQDTKIEALFQFILTNIAYPYSAFAYST